MIEAFVPAGSYRLIRRFTTPEGAPKSVWRERHTGALLILGSLPRQWPDAAWLEALLPWLNGLGASLAEKGGALTLRRYHRAFSGRFVVPSADRRHFLASYQDRVRSCRLADGRVLARALADFHRLGSEWMVRQPLPLTPDSLANLLQHWLFPGLQAARPDAPPDLRAALDAALLELSGWREGRVESLDALPHRLIHGDWQAKNLLLARDAETVHVLDSESCRLLPRLFDVYFLLSWDDFCRGRRRPDLALARLRHYLDCSGGLTTQERELLPDVLRLKALANALWAMEGERHWRQRSKAMRAIVRHSLTMADDLKEFDTSRL